ncbi:MAG: putative peptidoglycan glycosyltransferase FtsW [bacterium]|jgi:cell division protein FtsW|nr:putative peptidoglycan glycosyltransferase FtsW [bacterium]
MMRSRHSAGGSAGLPLGIAPRVATIDRILAFVILLILSIGSLAVYSASSHFGVAEGSAGLYFVRHLEKILIGLILFFVMMKVDYRHWRPLAPWIGAISLLLLAVTLFMPPINGARRWILLGGRAFQPVDVAKFGLVLMLASSLARVRDFRRDWRLLLSGSAMMLAGMFILVLQPNFSMVLALFGVTMIMVFLAGLPLTWLLGGGTLAALGATVVLAAEEYRRARILSWVASLWSPDVADMQQAQSLIAFARGGLTGVGGGNSMQKLFYLPEPFNDFIFAIFGEEYGLAGCLLLVVLYAIVFSRGLHIVRRSQDDFARMLAAGITGIFFVHSIINLFVATGLFPVTGQPLPLFSYGGTSMITMLAALGVLMNLSYHARNVQLMAPGS